MADSNTAAPYEKEDQVVKLDLNLWKKLFQLIKSMRRDILLMCLSMILLAATDSLYPLLTAYAIDHFIANQTTDGLVGYAVILIAFMIFSAGLTRFFIYYAGQTEIGLSYNVREKAFAKLQELSLSYFDRNPIGWLLSRIISDVNRLSEVVAWGIVDFVWSGFSIHFMVISMFILNWQLALIALAVIPPRVLISIFFQKRILEAQRKVRAQNSRLTAVINEGITGAKTTKTLLREAESLAEYTEIAGKFRSHSIRALNLAALYMPVVSVMGGVGAALVLWQGGDRMNLGVLELGVLYAFVIYITRIFDPIRNIARVLSDFQSAQAAAERVLDLMVEEPELKDSPDVIAKWSDPNDWSAIRGKIEFKNVYFHYLPDEPILQDFNLTVNPGETIALVGATGSGKSTIVNLACRFYEPVSGEIYVDDIEYRDRPMNWMYSQLGYVLQTPYLFNASIKENIRFGKLDASDDEIIEACRLVRADEFIEKMEHGYDTVVGEGGGRLSVGQKQLISFARAIVGKPSLFVLDEATSSIDTETERMIQDGIERALAGRTSFVIAHRLSTILTADRILYIENGRIAEMGTHHELMKLHGKYYELYLNQYTEEQLLA